MTDRNVEGHVDSAQPLATVRGVKYIRSYKTDLFDDNETRVEEVWVSDYGLVINLRQDYGSCFDYKGLNVVRSRGPRDDKEARPVRVPFALVQSALAYLSAKEAMMAQRHELKSLFDKFEDA